MKTHLMSDLLSTFAILLVVVLTVICVEALGEVTIVISENSFSRLKLKVVRNVAERNQP